MKPLLKQKDDADQKKLRSEKLFANIFYQLLNQTNMKHFTKIFTAFILVVISMQPSCKKSDTTPAAVDVAASLKNKNWKITALTVTPAIGGTNDIYHDLYDDCERDNLYKFNDASVFLYDEGATKCYPADSQTLTGTWSYNATTKILHYQIVADMWDLTVTSISETSFVATSTDVDAGITYLATWTFAKQ